MREELTRQHKENGKIRKNCESQRKAMQLQRAAVKLQQETADAWRTLETRRRNYCQVRFGMTGE